MKLLQVISIAKFATPRSAGGVYGAERSTILLSRGLAQRGHEVTLVCQQDAPLIGVAQDAATGIETLRIAPTRLGSPRDPRAVWRLMRAARQQSAELLVAHDPRASRLSLLAGRLLRLPVVATVRGLYEVKGYRSADRIIAVSEGVREHVIAGGVGAQRVRTVYNGVDLSRFVPPDDLSKAKRAVALDAARPVVGLIGRLSPEKGHDWFFEAAVPVAREFPDALFVLVGDGSRRGELEQKVAALGLAGQVHFVGYQSDIVPWMNAMDFLVLPSVTSEGFARVLIEAGALGKTAVTSPVGGNAEAVIDGQTGLLVPVNDASALSGAMARLLRHREERERLGRAMRERVEAHFTVARMVENSEAVYRELLELSH